MTRERGDTGAPSPPAPGFPHRAGRPQGERGAQAEHALVADPAGDAARAIEHTLTLLDQVSAGIASGDDDRLATAYEVAASCTDHIARALWYLRRAQRDGEGAAAGAGVAPGASTTG